MSSDGSVVRMSFASVQFHEDGPYTGDSGTFADGGGNGAVAASSTGSSYKVSRHVAHRHGALILPTHQNFLVLEPFRLITGGFEPIFDWHDYCTQSN